MFSCGKEIQTTGSGSDLKRTHALKVSNIHFNFLIDTELIFDAAKTFQSDGSGWARIPTGPTIISGNPVFFESRVYINITSTTDLSDGSHFFCEYTSLRLPEQNSSELEDYIHIFNGCKEDIDNDGVPDLINYNVGDNIALQEGNFIRVEVTTSESDDIVEIHSEIEVDWH